MSSALATVGRFARASRRLGTWSLPERPAVMAIVNLTPDSFSDGGRTAPVDLRERVAELIAAGADILDVGAESTRPGAAPVSAAEQLARLAPLFDLLPEISIPVSIDTQSVTVAAAALTAGAEIINDVSGGRRESAMAATVAAAGGVLIAMHMRGDPRTMDSLAQYRDIAAEVVSEWGAARDAAVAAGLPMPDVWFDPGIGLPKSSQQNWQVLRAFVARRPVAVPCVYGISRKSFVAFGEADAQKRDAASVALATLLAAAGVDVLRMHDVAGARRAVDVATAMASEVAA